MNLGGVVARAEGRGKEYGRETEGGGTKGL